MDADTAAVTLLQFKNKECFGGFMWKPRGSSNWGIRHSHRSGPGSLGKVSGHKRLRKRRYCLRKISCPASTTTENFPDRFELGYRLELEAFFSALREGRTQTPGPEDALESLRLALAVTKSWREKRSVNVKEIQI